MVPAGGCFRLVHTSLWLFWQAMSREVNDRSFFASTAAPAPRSSRTASRWPPLAASSRGVNALSLRASMFTPPSRSWQKGVSVLRRQERGGAGEGAAAGTAAWG